MEQGLLEPRGVSDRVLDALGDLLGTTRERLREAAGALGPAAPPASDALFARTAVPDPAARARTGAAPPAAASPPEERDEVDRLFRGG